MPEEPPRVALPPTADNASQRCGGKRPVQPFEAGAGDYEDQDESDCPDRGSVTQCRGDGRTKSSGFCRRLCKIVLESLQIGAHIDGHQLGQSLKREFACARRRRGRARDK